MKKAIFYILIIYFIQTACSKYDKKDLIILDNLQLGISAKSFIDKCDSLSIKHDVFLTETFISEGEDIEAYLMKGYYTERFNFSEYSDRYLQHYGLFNPVKFIENNIVFKLNILLVHVSPPLLLPSKYNEEIRKSLNVADQDVREDFIKEVKNLLISKYGTPNDTISGSGIPMYILQFTKIKEFNQDPKCNGKLFVWNTKALDIKLFTGIRNPRNYYTKEIGYMKGFHDTVEIKEGDIYCTYGAYLSYEIRPEVIKNLKLDNINL